MPATQRSFFDRLETKIQKGEPNTCWKWLGAFSWSGYRGVCYPSFRIGGRKYRAFRVNRLLLILKQGSVDVPMLEGEVFEDWILRVNAQYRRFDAAHTCDNAGCCNDQHLVWQEHGENIAEQVRRRRVKAAEVC
jgi:hypothetical protein